MSAATPRHVWTADPAEQFVALNGRIVAMAENPQRAQGIVKMLNAQEVGACAAEDHYRQRIADIGAELHKIIEMQQRRAERAEAEVARLREALEQRGPIISRAP